LQLGDLPIGDKDLFRRKKAFEHVRSCVGDKRELDTEAGEDTNDEEGDEGFEYAQTTKCSIGFVESKDEERVTY
jgi:hypothetical protein